MKEIQFEKNMKKKNIKDDIQKLLDDANDNDYLKLKLEYIKNNTRILRKEIPRGEIAKTSKTNFNKEAVKFYCIDNLNKMPIKSKLFKYKISKYKCLSKAYVSLKKEINGLQNYEENIISKLIINHNMNNPCNFSDQRVKNLSILNKINEKDLPNKFIIECNKNESNLKENIPRINTILHLIQKIIKETALIFEIPNYIVEEFVNQSPIIDKMELARYIIDQNIIKHHIPVLRSNLNRKKKKKQIILLRWVKPFMEIYQY